MAGVFDFADFGVGVRAVLFAQQRVYDAAISGATIQPAVRGVSGGNFDYCVHLHEDFGAAVCGERGAGARGGMVAVEDGDCAGDSDGNLHNRGRTGGGDLHRYGSDADFDYRGGGADFDRITPRRRIFTPADDGATELLPHDQARDGLDV